MGEKKAGSEGMAKRLISFTDLMREIASHPPDKSLPWPTVGEVKRAPVGDLIAWLLWLPTAMVDDPNEKLHLYIQKLICFRAQEYRRAEGSWNGEELAVTEEDLENAFDIYTRDPSGGGRSPQSEVPPTLALFPQGQEDGGESEEDPGKESATE